MRILVLTSRFTATRDIIKEDFGRQIRLFSALKRLGHKIDIYCADYRSMERRDTYLNGMRVFIRPLSLLRIPGFIAGLRKQARMGSYDAMIASSDPLWGILGLLTKDTKTKLVYDLHDNYEVYGTYKIPLFGFADRLAMRRADLLTTVSHTLKRKVNRHNKRCVVIQNGVDFSTFKARSKRTSRLQLGIPKGRKVLVYAGSMQRSQGIDLLIEAHQALRKKIPDLWLYLAGRHFGREKLDLDRPGIKYLGGDLPQKKVAQLINAGDVAVVPNRENDFTRFCFPYKVAEYMACGTPIVATRVGDVSRILKRFPETLCRPGDTRDLQRAIERQLSKAKNQGYRKEIQENRWDVIAKLLDKALRKLD